MKVYIDFETSSGCDLFKTNASVYSNHPSTEILCAVFIKENGDTLTITDFDPFGDYEDLFNWIEHLNADFIAHNAIFEQLIWQNILVKRYGYPELPPSRWRCTKAKGLACSLPGSLEKLAEALNLLQKKDTEGKKLMLKMCKPDGPRDEESMDRLIRYCREDVLTTMAIDKALPDLSDYEQKVWELDQEINLRGVRLDKKLIQEILGLLKHEKDSLLQEFQTITNISSPSCVSQFKTWINSFGYNIKSVDAKTVKSLLVQNPGENVKRALQIRQILGKSSIAKYQRMLDSMDEDERVRENLVYHGASTGRWTGQGTQLQNLPRPKIDIRRALDTRDVGDIFWPYIFGSVSGPASSLLRSCLIPSSKRKSFFGGDYSGIEARITPWIAGQRDTLEIFRQGKDIYLEAASQIYGRNITAEDEYERQVGKCAVLGLGYQGGIAAFYKMCVIYSVSLRDIMRTILASASRMEMEAAGFAAESYLLQLDKTGNVGFRDKNEAMVADIIKQRWRASNARVVAFWKNIEEESIEVVKGIPCQDRYPNFGFEVEYDFLALRLPSGRKLRYYKPHVKEYTTKFGQKKEGFFFYGVCNQTKQMVEEHMYGGKWTENIVQAIARDIMVNGMFNVKNYGADIVLTVHDEVLSENDPETDPKTIEQLLIQAPEWAKDLPLAAKCWKGLRYQK